MKKQGIYVLFLVTGMIAAFTVGFFVGRNTDRHEFSIQTFSLAATTTAPETTAATMPHYPLDLNTATKELLMTLPGVGEVLAQRILDYRTVHGPFSSVEELNQVEGIGDGKLDKIREYITIGGQS